MNNCANKLYHDRMYCLVLSDEVRKTDSQRSTAELKENGKQWLPLGRIIPVSAAVSVVPKPADHSLIVWPLQVCDRTPVPTDMASRRELLLAFKDD